FSTLHRFAPQVRVIDGRIELDMDSLTVDHAVVDAPTDQGPMEYVEESSATKFTNSASYSKKNKSEKWSDIETEMFYQVRLFFVLLSNPAFVCAKLQHS